MVTGCTITPLFDALTAFHGAHPGVEISLLEDNSERLIDGVAAPALLALVWKSPPSPAVRQLLAPSRQAFLPQNPGRMLP